MDDVMTHIAAFAYLRETLRTIADGEEPSRGSKETPAEYAARHMARARELYPAAFGDER